MRKSAFLLASLLAAPLASLAAGSPDWPRTLASGSTKYVVYQPEPAALDGNTLLARSAVSVQQAGASAPVFGAIETTSKLAPLNGGRDARVVAVSVDRVRFPGVREDSPQARELTTLLEREWPRWNLVIPVDELRQRLASASSPGALSNTPPRFVHSDEPAVLLSIDGEPRLQAIGSSGLERVVNTPFALVHDRPARRYYFNAGNDIWFGSNDLQQGSWRIQDRVPAAVAAVFADQPPQPVGAPEWLERARIIVALEPTELIATDGPAQLQPLVGSELLAVENTDRYVFLDVPSQAWYTVASGRWYTAPALDGSWSYVDPAALPASFANIPAGSPMAAVLAHVPGTSAARDAVLDSSIPQTRAVDRETAHFAATYDGPARFEQVSGTSLHFAVNTASQVILADGRYYAVEEGVWYIADSPYGPWSVSETRPNGLDAIPPSSPLYNTRYAYIYDVQPDVIYTGYTPGYAWTFPYAGTVVYGTGYRYRPWIGASLYYARPWTYGYGYGYWNPWPAYYGGYRPGYGGWHPGGGYDYPRYHPTRPPGHRPPVSRPPGNRPPDARPPHVDPRAQQIIVSRPVPGRIPSRPSQPPPAQQIDEQPSSRPPMRPTTPRPQIESPRTQVVSQRPPRAPVETPRAQPPRQESPPARAEPAPTPRAQPTPPARTPQQMRANENRSGREGRRVD